MFNIRHWSQVGLKIILFFDFLNKAVLRVCVCARAYNFRLGNIIVDKYFFFLIKKL